jgi:hypothetical protein
MNRMRNFHYFLTILLLIPVNCWPSTEINLVRSQFEALSHNVLNAPVEQQDEFARIALSELYHTYETELTSSYQETPSDLGKILKLNRWRQATKNYLGQVSYALQQILSGEIYEMDIDPQGIVLFLGRDFTVMVTGLNEKSDNRLERNIIQQFCGLYDCEAYLSKEDKSYIEATLPVVNGYWLIDKRHKADFFTYHGILFRFADLNNRNAKEDWSKRVTQDLIALDSTLNMARKKNYTIAPEALGLSRMKNQAERIILTVNQQNDFIVVDLPTISRVDGIIELVKVWLMQSTPDRSEVERAIILPAETLYNQP